MLDLLAWFGIHIGFDGISLTCWHFHVSIRINMMMIFRGVSICKYYYFSGKVYRFYGEGLER